MSFRITKQFHFSASHLLEQLPSGHPCRRLHGHNYIVEVELAAANLTTLDWVRDFGDLDQVKRFIDDQWDHRDLNDWFRVHGVVMQTTAEALAFILFHRFAPKIKELSAVRVSETPKTWAEYRPEGAPGGTT